MRIRFIVSLLFLVGCLAHALIADTPKTPHVAGEWSLSLTFTSGAARHTAFFKQKGTTLSGVYKGTFKEGTLSGIVKGDSIDFTGSIKHEATRVSFHYTGKITGDTMKGTVDMGEYWSAAFTGKRVKTKEKSEK